MVGSKFTNIVEKHSAELSDQLAQKLHRSERTKGFRAIPTKELERDIHVLYSNLGDWLLRRTENDVENWYSEIGKRRAIQKISDPELIWAFTIAKEHIIAFLRREANSDSALALFSELEFMLTLNQFFDRAIFFAINARAQAEGRVVAA